MRDNLNPVPITDKNGVTSTRWKKTGNDDTSSAKPLPAPALTATTVPADEYRAELADMLKEAASKYGDDTSHYLSKASHENLAYIHEVLTAGDKPDYFGGQITCLMNDHAEEHIMEAYIDLYEVHDGTLDDMGPVAYLRGAIKSGTDQPEVYDRHDPQRKISVTNLYNFILKADASAYTYNTTVKNVTDNGLPAECSSIDSREIADFIINNPEQTDDLIHVADNYPRDIYDIVDYAKFLPGQIKEIAEIVSKHPERLEGRNPEDIKVIIEASRDWTPVSEGVL